MSKKKNGFTLAEVMVTLAVLGVLAAIMLPVIAQIRPNKNKAMFKKAYYVAERMVFEMVNDDNLYPSMSEYYGFDNTTGVSPWGVEYSGENKFCYLFARKVNTTSDSDDNIKCDSAHAVPAANGNYTAPSFTTTDGVAWYMPNSKFPNDDDGQPGIQTIYVDVNGHKKPNCPSYGANSCAKPDILRIYVRADGKMSVPDNVAREWLSTSELIEQGRRH